MAVPLSTYGPVRCDEGAGTVRRFRYDCTSLFIRIPGLRANVDYRAVINMDGPQGVRFRLELNYTNVPDDVRACIEEHCAKNPHWRVTRPPEYNGKESGIQVKSVEGREPFTGDAAQNKRLTSWFVDMLVQMDAVFRQCLS